MNVRAIQENIGYGLAATVLVMSLSMNVVLAMRLRDGQPRGGQSGGVQAGDVLPTLSLATPTGTQTLSFDRPTLVYVFSPTCQWCMRDYANYHAIQLTAGSRYQFVSVTLTGRQLQEYLKDRPYSGVVGVATESALPERLAKNLKVTPQLLVVDTGGLVQQAWTGALFDSRQREAELFFDVKLPGLRAANAER